MIEEDNSQFQYKGDEQFEVQQNRFSLEFTKRFQIVQTSLDPDYLLKTLQENVEHSQHGPGAMRNLLPVPGDPPPALLRSRRA